MTMNILAMLAVVAVQSVVTNGVEVRWFEKKVPMADGVKLYTFGTVPPEGVKCPIIVVRDPYVKEARIDGPAFVRSNAEARRRGYAHVCQHVRGSGLSEGKRYPYEDERADGLALLEFVRKLPWYNGEIFLSGGSYTASVHWSYLGTNPSDVKGACLSVQEVNRYNICYRNGFFKTALHGGWFISEYWKTDHALTRNAKASLADFPLMDFSRRYWGRPEPTFDNVIAHPRQDDPFWQSAAVGSGSIYRKALIRSSMPILLKTGYYDIYTEGLCDMWRETPSSRLANCALLIDAYDHGGRLAKSMAGTLGEYPGGARADEHVEDLDWFDSIRAGKPCPGAPAGKVRYYALWENRWHEESKLPDGVRRFEIPLGQGERSYVYDPQQSLPVFPGSGGICFGGQQLQPEPNFRNDVLSFVLPPLAERLDVRGRMTATLTVSSDCEDTCFYLRVSVRKPDGKWYLLRDDITSLGFQLGDYMPGTKRRISFCFADHAFRLEKGDVLRADVSSASSQFAPHTNVRGEQFRIATPRIAHNRVFAAESELILPVLVDVAAPPKDNRVRVTVSADEIRTEISPNIYGAGMEDVNHEIYGGLDAQRLFGESFEELPLPCEAETIACRQQVSRCWTSQSQWAGELLHDRTKAHGGEASQLMIPNGYVAAVANEGLGNAGISVREGHAMIGHLYARGSVEALSVELQSADRKRSLAKVELNPTPGADWKRLDFRLLPTGTDPKGRFVIKAQGFGRLWIDDAYLADEPTNAFGHLGCREDVVEGLLEMGVNFLRWGGTMCNAEDYLLKNFGPDRKPYRGFWHRHSSGGFGPREFVRLAAEMKHPCAFSISVREEIVEAVRLAEELKAYDIPIVVQIGNEECMSREPAVCRRYCDLAGALVKAMRAANPKLEFATASWWMGATPLGEELFRRLDGIVDYWDLHLFFHTVDQCLRERELVREFTETIRRWNPKTKMRAAIFEENGSKHNLDRALCHALVLEKVREAGRDVLTSCPANCFQVWKQNDNGWDQGNVFMTPDQVWLAPCAWAQRMARDGHRELLVGSSCDDPDLHVSATRDRTGKSVVLHVVNTSADAKEVTVDLKGSEARKLARVVSLSGESLDADNGPDSPRAVAPVDETDACRERIVLKPWSYTVITLVNG